jgi:hypothetical protein
LVCKQKRHGARGAAQHDGKVESSFIFGKMIVIGDNMMRLVGIMVEISIRNDMVEFVYILIMCHRIYDVMGLHLYVLGDVVNFLFVISYCTSPFIDVTKGVVTYKSSSFHQLYVPCPHTACVCTLSGPLQLVCTSETRVYEAPRLFSSRSSTLSKV